MPHQSTTLQGSFVDLYSGMKQRVQGLSLLAGSPNSHGKYDADNEECNITVQLNCFRYEEVLPQQMVES
jgi:hypothetical protein